MIGGGKMNYGGQGPGPFGYDGQQGFPGQAPSGQYGPPLQTPGGSIRNNLGAGLKQSGFFQKDGHINNMRGGFIGQKQSSPLQGMPGQVDPSFNLGYGNPQGGMPGYGNPQGGMPTQAGQAVPPMSGQMGGVNPNQPRQLILQAAQEGIVGNGIATISPDNFFFLVANLPLPHTFLNQGQGSATYASYLVDNKGQTGFLAGVLRPIGNGVYQTQFRSSVPLAHYNRVIVSVENPQYLGQTPNGPIILKVKEPMGAATFLNPMKNVGGSLWKKVSGVFRGKSKVPIPTAVPDSTQVAPELIQSLDQMGISVNPGTAGEAQ